MRAAVVGAGLGGCAAALSLRAAGLEVDVFEAGDRPRRGGHSLTLLPRGTAALAALGVRDLPGVAVERYSQIDQRSGRSLHVDLRALLKRAMSPFMVCRREQLLDLLLREVGPVHYAKRCAGVTTSGSAADLRFDDGTQARVDLVVAADGAASQIRASLWPDRDRELLSVVWQTTADQPADYPSGQAVTVRGPCRFAAAFPTTEAQVNLLYEEKARSPQDTDVPWPDMLARFRALPDPVGRWFRQPSKGTFDTYPVFIRRPPRRMTTGRVVLVGDAAHCFTPSGGQGANEAFIDAVALGLAMAERRSVEDAMALYTRLRRRSSLRVFRLCTLAMRPAASRLIASTSHAPDFVVGNPLAARIGPRVVGPGPVVRRALTQRSSGR